MMRPRLPSETATAASDQIMYTATLDFTCLCSMWTTAERIKYHQSQTVYDSKSTVMCSNAGPSPNHKNALSLTSCKFCRAEVCTHPEKDYGCEEEMSLCERFAHNKEIRETKRGRQNLQVFLSHILTLKTGLSYSRTNGLRFPPPLCVCLSPRQPASSEYMDLDFHQQFYHPQWQKQPHRILNEWRKLCWVE